MSDITKKYNGYFKCFIDTETTGVDRKLNHLFQISGAILDKDDEILERFDFKFTPFSLEHVSKEALEKTGMTITQLSEFGDPRKAYSDFTTMLGKYCNKFDKADKMQMIAYNANFDSDFLREFFTLNGDNYFGSWFWNPPLCVMQMMAWITIRVRGSLPNYKLGTLCQAAGLGWDESKAHDAQYDIDKTIALYRYGIKMMPSI